MNIGKMVKLLMTDKTYEELADDILQKTGYKMHFSSLQKYVTGERKPSYKTLEALSEYADKIHVSVPEIKQLLGGSYKTAYQVMEVRERYQEVNDQIRDVAMQMVEIPIIGRVPAGGPVIAEENFEGMMPLPLKFVQGRENVFCLRVTGDSMIDVDIQDGDYVLVHQQPTAENGQTVVARINGEVTIKRFYKLENIIRLEPANSHYKALESREVEIVGVAFKVIKDLF